MGQQFLALGTARFAERVPWPREGEAYERVAAHPTRTLANALINACWRNGPVEDVHAGVLERVLPYAFAQELLVTPTGWSLEETSREVRLPGGEQP